MYVPKLDMPPVSVYKTINYKEKSCKANGKNTALEKAK